MLDARKRRDLDEAVAALSEVLPITWRQLYKGCISEGFSSEQAMGLVKTYILSQNPYGIAPPNEGVLGEE